MSKQNRENQSRRSRGGSRPRAGRPSGTQFGELDKSIRLPLTATNDLEPYKEEYCELRRSIVKGDLPEEQARFELEKLGDFWHWALPKLLATTEVIDIAKYRKYSSVAATPETMGVTDESYEENNLSNYLMNNPHKSYLLDVVGDSMVDEGIYDGTLLIVEKYDSSQRELKGGEIVVASLGSSFSMMVKVFHRDESGQIFLLSANHKYAPIAINEEHDQLCIQGLVRNIVNKPGTMLLSHRQKYMSQLRNEEREFT